MPRAAIYGPADRKHGGWIDRPMPYYALLAGMCRATRTRRAIEIGTHYGGSTLSLLAGMRAGSPGSRDLRIVTVDPKRLNDEGLAAHAEIHRIDDAMPGDGAARAINAALVNAEVDLVFVDALKSHEFVGEVLLELTWRFHPRLLVLDDVRINASMRRMWQLLVRQLPRKCIEVSSFAPDIRAADVGIGIAKLETRDLPLDIRPRPSNKRISVLTKSVLSAFHDSKNGTRSKSKRHVRESNLLRFIGAHYLSGRGAALDCGGEGAVALVEGLSANAKRSRIAPRSIHVVIPLDRAVAPGGQTKSRIAAALSSLRPHAGKINVYASRPMDFRWIGAPIELMVLHKIRSWPAASSMLRECMKFALPGESCLVTSDTIRRDATGLLLSLAMLMDDVSPILQIGHVVAFAVRAAPAAHRLERLMQVAPDVDESLVWLDRFARTVPYYELAAHSHLAGAELALSAGDSAGAASRAHRAERSVQAMHSPTLRSRLGALKNRLNS